MDSLPIKPINIPAVLNDPNSLNRDIFSKRYGESFENFTLPKFKNNIIKSDFDLYLKVLKDFYELSYKSRISNVESPINDEIDLPNHFFEKDFSFDNPLVYKSLIPSSSENLNTWLGPANQIHKQLSQQLDAIETKIAYNVSKKSEDFLHALAYVSNLRDNLLCLRDTICTTRKSYINYLQTYMISRTKFLKLYIKYLNYIKILKKLKIMSLLCQSQPTLQILLANNEYLNAFDLLSTSQNILLRDLNGIRSFRHTEAQFIEIENVIFRMLWGDYTSILLKFLNDSSYPPLRHQKRICDESTSQEDGLTAQFNIIRNGIHNYLPKIATNKDELNILTANLFDVSTQLTPILSGLLYLKNFSFVEYYKDQSCAAIDNLLIQHVQLVTENYVNRKNSQNNITEEDAFVKDKVSHGTDDGGSVGVLSREDRKNIIQTNLPHINLKTLLKFYMSLFNELHHLLKHVQIFAMFATYLVVSLSQNQFDDTVLGMNNTNIPKLNSVLSDYTCMISDTKRRSKRQNFILDYQDRENVLDKLGKAVKDILKYLEDELSRILERWSLSFNPLFLVNVIHYSKMDSFHPENLNKKQFPDETRLITAALENNKLLSAFVTMKNLLGVTRNFYESVGTNFNLYFFTDLLPLLFVLHHNEKDDKDDIPSEGGIKTKTSPPCTNLCYPTEKNPFSDEEDGGDQNSFHSLEQPVDYLADPRRSDDRLEPFDLVESRLPYDSRDGRIDQSELILLPEQQQQQQRYLRDANIINNDDDNDESVCRSEEEHTEKESPNNSFFSTSTFGYSHLNLIRKIVIQTITYYVNRAKKELKFNLSKEKWKPVEIPKTLTDIYERIINKEFSELSEFVNSKSTKNEEDGIAASNTHLTLNEESYLFCNSGLILLRYVLILICLSESFKFTEKLISTALYHLFKLYNSSVSGLLLGAGAINSAGLKSITIKHLALSLNNLLFFSNFVALIQTTLLTNTNAITKNSMKPALKNSTKNFDTIHKEFKVHIEDTMNKISEIMEHNLSNYIAEWEIKSPTPSSTFKNITRQIELFFTNIRSILPFETLKIIMGKIDRSLKRLIKYKVNSIGIVNDGGPRAGVLISELLFYQDSMKKLGLGALNLNNNHNNNSNGNVTTLAQIDPENMWDFLN